MRWLEKIETLLRTQHFEPSVLLNHVLASSRFFAKELPLVSSLIVVKTPKNYRWHAYYNFQFKCSQSSLCSRKTVQCWNLNRIYLYDKWAQRLIMNSGATQNPTIYGMVLYLIHYHQNNHF